MRAARNRRQAMTEDKLLHAISDLYGQLDPPVRNMHLPAASRSGGPWRTGLADLFLLGTHSCASRELKPARGRARGSQQAWLFWLAGAGQDVGLWQPADWLDGMIAAELESLNLTAGQEAVEVVSDEQDAERSWRRCCTRPAAADALGRLAARR